MTGAAALETENRRLRDEVATLREALRQAEEAVCPPLCLPAAWGMTSHEQRFLLALYAAKGEVVTRFRMSVATHGVMSDRDGGRSVQNRHLCNIRRKLRVLGVPVTVHVVKQGEAHSDRAAGWCLDRDSLRVIGEAATVRPVEGGT